MFGVKMVSLSWVCWPYSAGWGVLAVVVGLAVGDLHWGGDGYAGDGRHGVGGYGDGGGGRGRSGSGAAGSDQMGEGNGVAVGSGLGEGERLLAGLVDGEREERGGTAGWLGGWRRSLVLLVMHCVVVGVTARVGVLCAGGGGRRDWEEW